MLNVPDEITSHIFRFLARRNLSSVATVSKTWNKIASVNDLWEIKKKALEPIVKNKTEFLQVISRLPRSMTHYICSGEVTEEQLIDLIEKLLQPYDNRVKFIKDLIYSYLSDLPTRDSVWREWGYILLWAEYVTIAAFSLKLVSLPEGLSKKDVVSTISILARVGNFTVLTEKLLTLEQLCTIHPLKLECLLKDNSLKALRLFIKKGIALNEINNLFHPHVIQQTANSLFKTLISNNGLIALEENLITIKEAQEIGSYKLYSILNPEGFRILRNHYIPREELFKMDSELLGLLLSDAGIKLIEDKLITLEQFKEQAPVLAYFRKKYSSIGPSHIFQLLRENIITWNQVCAMWHISDTYKDQDKPFIPLKWLFSGGGVDVLRKKLITIDQAQRICALGEQGRNFLREFLSVEGIAVIFRIVVA